MSKYRVTFEFSTFTTVEAPDEDEAIELAIDELSPEYNFIGDADVKVEEV